MRNDHACTARSRGAGDELPRPLPFQCSTSALVIGAFNGSLDAALTLHDSLLPSLDWCVAPTGASVYSADDNRPVDADMDDPARAWLLATLRAVEAEGQQ